MIVGVGDIEITAGVHSNACRLENRAAEPLPSVLPLVPANPAIVFVAPVAGSNIRIVKLPVSAT